MKQETWLHCIDDCYLPCPNVLKCSNECWPRVSSITGYHGQGLKFNFPTVLINIGWQYLSCKMRREGEMVLYSPIWLGGLSRSTPVMRILELERESFLVRLDMVLNREETWRPGREKMSEYPGYNITISTSTISYSNLFLQTYSIYLNFTILSFI